MGSDNLIPPKKPLLYLVVSADPKIPSKLLEEEPVGIDDLTEEAKKLLEEVLTKMAPEKYSFDTMVALFHEVLFPVSLEEKTISDLLSRLVEAGKLSFEEGEEEYFFTKI